jgi:hypothetical protein
MQSELQTAFNIFDQVGGAQDLLSKHANALLAVAQAAAIINSRQAIWLACLQDGSGSIDATELRTAMKAVSDRA